MHDYDLVFAENARPAVIPAPIWGKVWFDQLVAPKYLDMRSLIDLGRGQPVFANFKIATAFNNVAANSLRFAVFASNDPTFADVLASDAQTIATSLPITGAGLASVGATVRVAIPPMNDYALSTASGRRYVTLGFEYLVPTTDWTQGGIDAWLSNRAVEPAPLDPPAGY